MDYKDYELAFLVAEESGAGTIEEALASAGAEILSRAPLKNISLTYPIKKQTSAFFGCLTLRSLPEKIDEIRKTLELNQGVLRQLIITPPIAKQESRRWSAPAPEAEPPKVGGSPILSNEALEKQIEEILS